MCCFTRPVHDVSATRIFARALGDQRQFLAYSMSVAFDGDVAMVLPLPVAFAPDASHAADDALRFVDLSSAPRFFDDLEALFPKIEQQAKSVTFALAPAARAKPNLVVHDVGDFEASFVPRVDDFARLDERFRLPPSAWRDLPQYADHAFAVFKLKKPSAPGRRDEARTFHPMAFEFPRRDADTLFFPTVHIHDGRVHTSAVFDHTLYAQIEPAWEPLFDWQHAETPVSKARDATRRFLHEGRPLFRRQMQGELPNRDTIVDAARLAADHVFGPSFRLRIRSAWKDTLVPGRALDPSVARWARVTDDDLVRIRTSVGRAVADACAANERRWGLTAFRHDLPAAHPSAYEAFRMPVPRFEQGSLVNFYASNERIESQELTIAFGQVPSVETCRAITAMFQGAIDRATG